MRALTLGTLVVAWLGVLSTPALAKVRIVASINDLGSIAAAVGGEHVEVVAIARPNSDPHRVEVLPSYMVRVSRASVYLKVGLGLDQWAIPIIDGSHNGKLLVVDCSKGVSVVERPTGKVDASMGDVHPDGNPHYWLDPRNAAIIARTVAAALASVDPPNASNYATRAEQVAERSETAFARGKQSMAGLTSHDLLTYHRSWSYFATAFDLQVVATIEPIPGIPPTARHLNDLIAVIRERRVRAVLEEPYFSEDAGKLLARQTGIRILRIPAMCGDTTSESYFMHFEQLFDALAGASIPGGS
jgi:ABC-type Zn uptake system ZnuABC Zn-binding protein ZnuA